MDNENVWVVVAYQKGFSAPPIEFITLVKSKNQWEAGFNAEKLFPHLNNKVHEKPFTLDAVRQVVGIATPPLEKKEDPQQAPKKEEQELSKEQKLEAMAKFLLDNGYEVTKK